MPKSKLVVPLHRVSSSIETCGPPYWRLEGCCHRILTPVVALCLPRVEKLPPAEETAKSARDSQLRAVSLPSLSRLRHLAKTWRHLWHYVRIIEISDWLTSHVHHDCVWLVLLMLMCHLDVCEAPRVWVNTLMSSVCRFDCIIWFCATFNKMCAIWICCHLCIRLIDLAYIYHEYTLEIHILGVLGSAQHILQRHSFCYSMHVIMSITVLSSNLFHHSDWKSGADGVGCSADCQDSWTLGNKVVSLMPYQ